MEWFRLVQIYFSQSWGHRLIMCKGQTKIPCFTGDQSWWGQLGLELDKGYF